MSAPLLTAAIGATRLDICVADITTLDVDAIVNAANTHAARRRRRRRRDPSRRRAGLLAECSTLGGCETGSAKITRGYRLKAKHVIHAVGPVWERRRTRRGSAARLLLPHRAALAAEHGLASIAFPAISTGVYRFPPDRAARIAVGTVAAEIAAAAARHHAGRVLLLLAGCRREHHETAFAELGFGLTSTRRHELGADFFGVLAERRHRAVAARLAGAARRRRRIVA